MAQKEKGHIAIIGGGLTGLTTAYQLAEKKGDRVIVLEKLPRIGGLAGSFSEGGNTFDFGSHRIHPAYKPEALSLIRELCGTEVLKRERGGKLRLRRNYINYPITSYQMFKGIGLIESGLCALSLFGSKFRSLLIVEWNQPLKESDSFEKILRKSAGNRAYQLFYEPYAQKVWGIPPNEISSTAVKKRVSMLKPLHIIQSIIRKNFFKERTNIDFFYPRGGIGRISQRLGEEIVKRGGEIKTGVRVEKLLTSSNGRVNNIVFSEQGRQQTLAVETVISTIPFPALVHLIGEAVPEEVEESLEALSWRGLHLVYLFADQEPLETGETFYFPELRYIFGRASIPKRFDEKMQSSEGTAFVCEVPCTVGDHLWSMPTEKIAAHCLRLLKVAGLLKRDARMASPPISRKLPNVYAVFRIDWQENFRVVNQWIASFENVYTSGRQGLFLHCNIDHAIYMGLRLATHLLNGTQRSEWEKEIESFMGFSIRD